MISTDERRRSRSAFDVLIENRRHSSGSTRRSTEGRGKDGTPENCHAGLLFRGGRIRRGTYNGVILALEHAGRLIVRI